MYRFNNLSEIDDYRNILKKRIAVYEKNIVYDYRKMRKRYERPLSVFAFVPKLLRKNLTIWGAFVSGFNLIKQIQRHLKKSAFTLFLFLILLPISTSCSSKIENTTTDKATILLSFASENIVSISEYIETFLGTKAENEIFLPDTNNFHLLIRDNSDNIVYSGSYGNRPEQIMVNPGSYTISTYSQPFTEPDFNVPQFGDEQNITLSFGQAAEVRFNCTQTNAGLKLIFNNSFIQKYSDGCIKVVSVVASTSDTLDYPFNSEQYAFFFPGPIKLFVAQNKQRTLLTAFNLEAAEMRTLDIKSVAVGEQFSMSVDTTRIWTKDEFTLGVTPNGSSAALAVSANNLSNFMGLTDFWVEGYIVGTFKTGSANFSPFVEEDEDITDTNIAISSNRNATSASECISANLSKNSVKAALNLKSNPNNYQKKVRIKGEVATYMGVTGIRNVSDFVLE